MSLRLVNWQKGHLLTYLHRIIFHLEKALLFSGSTTLNQQTKERQNLNKNWQMVKQCRLLNFNKGTINIPSKTVILNSSPKNYNTTSNSILSTLQSLPT